MTTKATDISGSGTTSGAAGRPRGRVTAFLRNAPTFHLVLIGLLLALAIALAIWRAISIDRLEDELAATRKHDREVMFVQSGDLLRLTAIPLAWAIRSAAMSNATGDIDAYMQQLVQEQFVKRIVFVDTSGKVVSSTNMKLKDQPAASVLPGIDLAATAPRVEHAGDDLRIIVPVMSFERQIGTLVLDYSFARSIDAKLEQR